MNPFNRVLISKPGIQRDGTEFDSNHYVDGQHCRFYRGKPRKMGGYKLLYPGTSDIIRSLYNIFKSNNTTDIYMGRYNRVSYFPVSGTGVAGPEVDRTPVGFPSIADTRWYFDAMTANAGITNDQLIIAAAIPNGNDISSTAPGSIYFGNINNTLPLTQIALPQAQPSGGIVVVPPFLFWFGNDGLVYRSKASDPTVLESTTNIAKDKIIAGLPVGASTTPAVLFWSLTSLVRGVFDGTTQEFSYSTIENNISIMSSNCVLQYSQTYFWIGKDQFYYFNGVVKTLPNDMNRNFFFENVNRDQTQKIWGYVNRDYHELWWFYPSKNSTECDRAVIYNLDLNTLYDTKLNRSAGVQASLFEYPLLADSQLQNNNANVGLYGVWQHEFGTDKELYGRREAIPSYYQTRYITLPDENPQANLQLRTRRIEPDFILSGKLNLTVYNKQFPQSPTVIAGPYEIQPNTEKVDLAEMSRIVSFRFESNEVGGFYEMGKVRGDFLPGDERP